MRIAFLADAYFSEKPGGSRRFAMDLARALTARGHSITYLVPKIRPDLADDEQVGDLRIRRYAPGRWPVGRILSGRRAFLRAHAETPFDMVMPHFAYAAVGYHLTRISRSLPTVRMFHGPWGEELRFESGAGRVWTPPEIWAANLFEKLSLSRSHRVMGLSGYMAGRAAAAGACEPERITVIPALVDLDLFTPGDKASARRELGLPRDRPIMLAARRLARRMGLDRLIRAMATVRRRDPSVLLLIAGDGALRPRLVEMIGRLELDDMARLLGGIDDRRLVALYRAADVSIVPSVDLEGFGLVILESFACGTPVLGTPVAAIPEVLERFDEELLLPSAEPQGIAAGILGYLERRDEFRGRAAGYRAICEEQFAPDRCADAVEKVMQEACAGVAAS